MARAEAFDVMIFGPIIRVDVRFSGVFILDRVFAGPGKRRG
jgi:hypothetical protein